MKALIIYDSEYGNTEKIAEALASSVTKPNLVKLSLVKNINLSELESADVLIVGSPTQGGRATKTTHSYLNSLPKNALIGKKVAAFDTRFAINNHGIGLKLLMKMIGFAAPKIANVLKSKGGQLATEPEGFIVTGQEGPLAQGEIERAAAWIKNIL